MFIDLEIVYTFQLISKPQECNIYICFLHINQHMKGSFFFFLF